MARFTTSTLAWLGAIAVFSGCAAGGGNADYKDITRSAGEASLVTIDEKTLRILNKFQFQTVRQAGSPQLVYYETSWKYRLPFDDERSSGVVEARTRLTIKARPRRASVMAGASNMYAVQIVAENMVQMADNGAWIQVPNSDAFKAYVRDIAKALENELRMSLGIF